MNKESITKVFKDIQNGISKRSPEILTGIGIAGMITTTVLAVKATPKALEKIESEKRRQNRELLEDTKKNGHETVGQVTKLKLIETVKVAWKPYIPAAVTGTLSVACLIGASSVNARRNAALATAYQISQTALSDYKAKVVETIGEKKEHIIREKVAEKKVEDHPIDSKDVIITGGGKTLCLDAQFGKYFESDIETIKKAINVLNATMIREEYVSLNDLYDEIGVERIPIGDELGWNIGRDGIIDVQFSSAIAKDGRPCIVLQYDIAPKYDYFKF